MTTSEGIPTTPAECADAAAELVRAINHTTRPGAGGLHHVGDVYDTTAGLALLVSRLPQAVSQLAAHLSADAAAGRLTEVDEHGQHGDPADAARVATGRLKDAAHAARVLASLLEDAQQALAVLSHP
jgi:hypothetical protein